MTDAAGDLPSHLAPYDLTGLEVTEANSLLQILVSTVAPPSLYGEYGDYVITFDNLSWAPEGPTTTHRAALQLTEGSPIWHAYDSSGLDNSGIVGPGLTWSMGSGLTISADMTQLPGLADWSAYTATSLSAWPRS